MKRKGHIYRITIPIYTNYNKVSALLNSPKSQVKPKNN